MARSIANILVIQLVIIGTTSGALTETDKAWSEFKETYGKTYDSPNEELRRRDIFLNNLVKVRRSQELYDAGLETYWLGINEYSDLTTEEQMQLRGLNQKFEDLPFEEATIANLDVTADLPAKVDWRENGACNPARKQGENCNDCVAFTTVEAVESHYFIRVNKSTLLALSPQNLDDCASLFGYGGCTNGGHPPATLQYIQNQGIELEDDYRYKAADGPCRFIDSKSVLKIKDFKTIRNDEAQIQAAVANLGPVIVPIEANQDWLQYKGGILKASKPFAFRNHAVVVDGYGTENGEDYWLLRNSWGPTFGEDGYLRIRRNSTDFGFGQAAYYPEF